MKVTLIYGREGSGKSRLIYNMCNAKRGSSKIAVIVPDQYTHQTELDLIAEYNSSGLMDTEVLSFKRLSHRLKLLYGGASVIVLSEEGKSMLINRIINSCPEIKNGEIFSNTAKTDVCGDIAKLISRFKQYSITPQMLEECAVDGEKYSHTKAKLDEIALIYKNYVQMPFSHGEQSFFDDEDDMTLLCSNIMESGILAEYDVFLDGFDDFSKTELEIAEALIISSKSVTISLPCDCALNKERAMLFNRQIQMIKNIEAVVEKCTASANKIWLTDDVSVDVPGVHMQKTPDKKARAISYIEKNIFSMKPEPVGESVKGLRFVKESNVESETEHMADKITELVRDEGCRYNEIAVICSDIQKYKSFVANSFGKRKIPFFMDVKRSVKDNSVIRYILGLLDVCVRKRSADSVPAFLKTGLLTRGLDNNDGLPFSYTDVAYIEKYCAQYCIKGKDWDKDFIYGEKYFDMERLNSIRERVLYYITPMEKALARSATAQDISKAIENYIENLKISDVVNQNIEYLRNTGRNDIALEYSNIWNVLASVLSQINVYMGDVEISADDFLQTLRSCLENITINVIPACIDQVAVCGTGRTMAKHIRALFILGAENISTVEESAVFNMAELDMLKARNIDIGADSKNIICDEQYYIYKILSKPTELLYISSTDGEDSTEESSNPILINALKNLFGNNLRETRNPPVPYALGEADNIGSVQSAMLYEMTTINPKTEEYYKLDEWLRNNGDFKYAVLSDVAQRGKNYTLATERAQADSLIKKKGEEYIMDISRLEKYAQCPYSYFVRYCLNPKSDVFGKASALDVGNIVHQMLDMFTETVMKKNDPCRDDVIDFMNTNFDKTAGEYESGKFNATDANKYILKRTKNFLTKMMTVMAEQKCSSGTVLFAAELPFDDARRDTAALPSVECFAEDGVKFKITGKIDCVEYFNSEHGRYWIVSDYKTGKNPSNSDIVNGRSLQLPIYMFAVLNNDKASMPGAMFYVGVNDNLIKPSSEQNLSDFLKKKYGRVGIITEDEELYGGLDKNCRDEDKNKYDIKISDTIANTKLLSVVEAERMSEIVSGAVKTAGDIFCDIKNGYIVKAPSHRDGCKYCEYRRFCGYDSRLKNTDERKYIAPQAEEGEE